MKRKYFLFFLLLFPAICSAQMKTYTHFYSHNHVTSIAARGEYVYTGYDCGLERRNILTGQTEEFFTYNSGLTISNFITALAFDSSGSLYISAGQFNPSGFSEGQYTGGLIKFDGKNWSDISHHFSKYFSPSVFVTYMAPDRKGNMWVVSSDGLYKYSSSVDSAELMLPQYVPDTVNIRRSVVSAAFDTSGNGYFATKESGLLKYDGKNWTKLNGLAVGQLSSVAIGKNGTIWVGFSEKGLARLDSSGWTYFNKSNSGLPDDSVTSLTVDSSGNLWAGTLHRGIARLSGTEWKVFNTSSGLPDSSIICLKTDSKRNVWAGTLSGGLSYFDGIKWNNANSSNSGLNSNHIKRVAVDSSNALWIVTDEQALFSFDGNKWVRYTKDNSGIPGKYVNEAAVDTKGRKWFLVSNLPFRWRSGFSDVAYSASAVLYDGKLWKIFDSSNTNPSIKKFFAIAFDSSGNAWFAIENGLAKYDGTNWSVFLAEDMVPPMGFFYPIRCIAVKANGTVYLGNESNIFRFDGKKWFEFYRGYKGVAGVNEMQIDHKEMLWTAMGMQYGGRIRGNLIKFNWYKGTAYSISGYWSWFWSVAVEKTNIVWSGTRWEGLYRIDGESDTVHTVYNISNSSLPDNDIRSIAIDRNNLKWIGTASAGISLFADNKMLLSGLAAEDRIPEAFSLSQNYPNPFNPATTISYSVAKGSEVTLKLYDILGREVALIEKGYKTAGNYKVKLDASWLPSGIYFYRLEAGSFSNTKKCALIK
ncbi:MAG: two-component regulator propeller domain-containing protein [Acidobacteriota bacterium]